MVKKKIITFLICFSILVSSSFPVYAVSMPNKEYLWNPERTTQENLDAYWKLLINTAVYSRECIFSGGLAGLFNLGSQVKNITDFGNFMTESKGYSEEQLSSMVVYNNNSKEYNISTELNNSFHEYVNNLLQENTGYITIPTTKFSDIPASYFGTKEGRKRVEDIISTFDYPVFLSFINSSNPTGGDGKCSINYGGFNYLPWLLNGLQNNSYNCSREPFETWLKRYNGSAARNNWFSLVPLFDDWSYSSNFNDKTYDFETKEFKKETGTYTYVFAFDKNTLSKVQWQDDYISLNFLTPLPVSNTSHHKSYLVSSDDLTVKVWKNLASFKEYDIGQQPYYTSLDWNNYDYSQNNSKSYSDSFVDNSVKDSNNTNSNTYNEIVNNYQTGMTEKEVADLVETILKNQQNNDNGNGNGNNSGGGSSSGSGLSDLLNGIGSIFDFIASLIGNVIGFIADLLTSTMNSISSVTGSLGGLSEAFSSAFSFLPPEVIGIITGGISLLVALAIIKFLIK